ncbi:protein prenyltransferase alpha subunit repeat-containing protein 1 [Bacillus rossius redtenbacheri]|uniref:protein prenyltransferase alpha subunit repeat-containing protein 1 n=1 Tax=Bacillus rossius redtenbacheri TaxID=93214 RepID=UPI002FDDA3B8
MQDEHFPAAERILSEIENVFRKDPELKEFDIVPVEESTNKSPVLHAEHCLGLESWCVRHVYCHAYHRLMDIRQQRIRREDTPSMLRLLGGALLLNPDVSTFWSMRREIIRADVQLAHAELHFTAVLLSRKPKCSEVFAHRRWLLGRLLQVGTAAGDVLGEELRVSQYAADRYPNNYYAWSHRMWCINQLAPSTAEPLKVLWEEWAASKHWVLRHVSDHSGLQYRQFLLKKLSAYLAGTESSAAPGFLRLPSHGLERSDECWGSFPDLLASEVEWNTELILRFSGHEALWCHRRFLLALLCSHGGRTAPPDCHVGSDGTPLEKDLKLGEPLAACEQALVSKCLPADVNQYRLSGQHCKWLARILYLNVHQCD